MIFHQSVGIKTERVFAFVVGKIGNERLQILLIKKYTLPSITPCDDMIQSSWKMNSRLTSQIVYQRKITMSIPNYRCLTPILPNFILL